MHFRVIPVATGHGRFQVVNDECLWRAAECVKGILDGANEGFRRLPPDNFAVFLARMTEHDSQHPRSPTPTAVRNDPAARAEVDLGFLAR